MRQVFHWYNYVATSCGKLSSKTRYHGRKVVSKEDLSLFQDCVALFTLEVSYGSGTRVTVISFTHVTNYDPPWLNFAKLTNAEHCRVQTNYTESYPNRVVGLRMDSTVRNSFTPLSRPIVWLPLH